MHLASETKLSAITSRENNAANELEQQNSALLHLEINERQIINDLPGTHLQEGYHSRSAHLKIWQASGPLHLFVPISGGN